MRKTFATLTIFLLCLTVAWAGPPQKSEIMQTVQNSDGSVDFYFDATKCPTWDGKGPIELMMNFPGVSSWAERHIITEFDENGIFNVHVDSAIRSNGTRSHFNFWPLGEGPEMGKDANPVDDGCDLALDYLSDNLCALEDNGWRNLDRIKDDGASWPFYDQWKKEYCEDLPNPSLKPVVYRAEILSGAYPGFTGQKTEITYAFWVRDPNGPEDIVVFEAWYESRKIQDENIIRVSDEQWNVTFTTQEECVGWYDDVRIYVYDVQAREEYLKVIDIWLKYGFEHINPEDYIRACSLIGTWGVHFIAPATSPQ